MQTFNCPLGEGGYMQITRQNGQLGVYSWTTGFVPAQIRQDALETEAKMNPEAVINRLLLADREEEAERILELYV